MSVLLEGARRLAANAGVRCRCRSPGRAERTERVILLIAGQFTNQRHLAQFDASGE
jgi:hypothetical protein